MKITVPEIDCRHKRKKRKYDSNIFTLDTEVTSLFFYNNEWKEFDFSKPPDFYRDKKKGSILYAWAFTINGEIIRGRYLEDFIEILDQLKDDNYIKVIYIQNLAYEFQFLLNIIPDLEPFALSPHKVVKAYTKLYNIEFRCSYILSGTSLKNFHKMFNLKSEKLVGDLDYNIVHLPITPLTEKEWGYIDNDVKVLHEYIEKMLNEYGSIDDIPLTQTGKVRRETRDLFKNDKKYFNKIAEMYPKRVQDFKELVEIFYGGYTHASWYYANKIIEDVETDDLSSDYPAQLVTKKFPITRFYKYNGKLENLDTNRYAYYILVEFIGLKSKLINTYISLSKTQDCYGYVIDNGRLVSAKYVRLRITDCDFEIIKKAYTYEDIRIREIKIAVKDYLDIRFRNYILQLYKNKTALKGVKGSEVIYAKSKEYINALYGMCVTNIFKDEIIFNMENGWNSKRLTEEDFKDKLQREIKKNKLHLNYAWGVWTTAYARQELWNLIAQIDDETVYCDTDSNKHIKSKKVDRIIKQRNKEWELKMKQAGLKRSDTHVKDPSGKLHILGTFERDEHSAKQFKTMGAKKYCSVYDDHLEITVSGVNKSKGAEILETIDNFKEGFVFDYRINKMIMTYIDDQPTITVTDYLGNTETVTQRYGINAMPTTYKLGIGINYDDLLNFINSRNISLSPTLGGFDLNLISVIAQKLIINDIPENHSNEVM